MLKISIQTLKRMDWKLFEELTAEIFKTVGYEAELTVSGPDGGVDVIVKQPGFSDKIAVQCKRQNSAIELKQVREFFGAMALQKYERGIFITTGSFNQRVLNEFGVEPRIELIDGSKILEGITELGVLGMERLSAFVFKGRPDWAVQTCPNCDLKMVLREPKKGKDWSPFWGCQNYAKAGNAKCRHIIERLKC